RRLHRAHRGREGDRILDDRVREVLARLEAEDARERAEGVARELRSRAVEPTTGRFLFALVAPQTDCEVLEIGGSRGYSTIWVAARSSPARSSWPTTSCPTRRPWARTRAPGRPTRCWNQ